MMICPYCNAPNNDNAPVCQYCGQPFLRPPQQPNGYPQQYQNQYPAHQPVPQSPRPDPPFIKYNNADHLPHVENTDKKKKNPSITRWLIGIVAVIVVLIVLNLGSSHTGKPDSSNSGGGLGALNVETMIATKMVGYQQETEAVFTAQTAIAKSWTATPAPTKTPEPTETPDIPPSPVSVSNSGKQVVPLPFKRGWIDFSYDGDGNFIVQSFDRNNESVDLIVNEIGPYHGTNLFNFFNDEEATSLQVEADGNWSMTIYPLHKSYLDRITLRGSRASGNFDDVICFPEDKYSMISANYSGDDNFIVTSISFENGSDLLFNEIGVTNGTMLLPHSSFMLIVNAIGNWTIDFK